MRILWVFSSLLAISVSFILGCGTAQAQWGYPPPPPEDHVERKFTLGLNGSLAAQGKLGVDTPEAEVFVVGGYLEASHRRARPALELKGYYGPYGVQGTLVGPRVAWKVDNVVFSASGLFGPAHYISNDVSGSTTVTTDQQGIMSQAAGTVEIMSRYEPFYGYRVTLATSKFTDRPQCYPLSLELGLILRIP